MNENWKVIPSLESYAINEDGVVKALPKIREGRLDCLNNHSGTTKKSQRKYKERIIKPKYTSRYWYVNLMPNGIKKNYRVHRLVYKTFVGNIPENMVIDHIDGNRDNNNISNLRCVTISENCQNPNTKYNKSEPILQIDPNSLEVIGEFKNSVDAELSFGVKYKPASLGTHITECCKGNRRTSFGYIWQYKKLWDKGIRIIKKDYRKAIVQLSLTGDFIAEFLSIKDASVITGLNGSGIQKCASGEYKTYKNYIWKYKESL